jgi:hypothetical protein
VSYLDSARLIAYDLPRGWQLVLDERKAVTAPEATGEPRFFREERLPAQAIDDDGRDLTRALTNDEHVAAPPGQLDPRYIGRTEAHGLTLRFDRALDDGQGDAMLVADGWIGLAYSPKRPAANTARKASGAKLRNRATASRDGHLHAAGRAP